MHVAVSIVGFRNPDDIVNCLAALEGLDHADFEVVICENGGPAAFAALTARLPAALAGGQPVKAVLAPGNLGYAGGVNICLAEAPGADAWWVLNPDTKPYPDSLGRLVRRLVVGDCEVAGGTTHFADGRVESHGGRWRPWLGRSESIGYGDALDAPVDAAALEPTLSYFSGACMLISRRFLEIVGPMHEDYFLYCEEIEWMLRGRALGMRLGYAPGARVLHLQGTTTGSVSDIRQRTRTPIYLDERNKMLVTWDRFPGRLPVAAAASFLLLFLRFGRRRAWRQLGYGLEGWLAGVLNRRGPPRWLPA